MTTATANRPLFSRRLLNKVDQKVFDALYSRSLVYNTCWEDPAVDRRALELRPSDRLLVITSAGCNALDYALAGISRVHAVDANPRQSALLELKITAIRQLEFDDFFALFGQGRHGDAQKIYRTALRKHLPVYAREFWDEHIRWFCSPSESGGFYFHGLSGRVARGFHAYLAVRPTLASGIRELLETRSLDEQREVYDLKVAPHLWSPFMNWVLSRSLTMSMLGVPGPQKLEVERQHRQGVSGFIRESIEYVFRNLPLQSNYFWTLYLRGRYRPECCPEYLKEANFARLKAGVADVISIRTSTITEFLRSSRKPISRFVLLDHMDWMSSYQPAALQEEWEAILSRASTGARIIFRSAHKRPAYLDTIRAGTRPLRDALAFQDGLAWALHPMDRVHTYAGFHIADVPS